jgi:hypothetical protein
LFPPVDVGELNDVSVLTFKWAPAQLPGTAAVHSTLQKQASTDQESTDLTDDTDPEKDDLSSSLPNQDLCHL